jgi:cardiolipin synthase
MEIPPWKHTVSNYMSLARMVVGIPLIALLLLRGNYGWTIVAIFATCISDWADGWVARRFNQESDMGRWLDPTADKAVVFSLLAMLLLSGKLTLLLGGSMCGLIAVQGSIAVTNIVAESHDRVVRVLRVGQVAMWLVMTSFGADVVYVWRNDQPWYGLALLFNVTGLVTSAVALAQYRGTHSTKQWKA